jgi:hypothetical protein
VVGGTVVARPVMVAGHERSGNHFLMNTLASNFGLNARRFISNDIATGADFYLRDNFWSYLQGLRKTAQGRIIKEHHHLEFFDGLTGFLRENFIVFYVVRNPADTMCSFWRYVRMAARREGPVTPTAGRFLRTPPSAGMLRYQMEQQPTILARWRAHVDSWTVAGAAEAGATVIRYEDLNGDFAATVAKLAERLEMPCPQPVRPSLTENVIVPGPGRVGGFAGLLDANDTAYIRQEVGRSLGRLGYAGFERWARARGDRVEPDRGDG